MKIVIDGIRSVFFNLAFYLFTIVFCTLALPVVFSKTEKPARTVIHIYCKVSLFFARYIMGIRYEYRGAEKLPKEGALVLAAAHQSYMDPILTYMLRQDVTALAKKELFQIPMIGPLIKRIGVIRIDRKSGKAHMGMTDVAIRVKNEGRPLIVYPQATRVPIGQRKNLKPGAFFIQKEGDLDVYPVATNTGVFWTKGFWHRSGLVIFQVQDRMKSDLEKDDFMQELDTLVVKNSDKLISEVGYQRLLPSE
ncbi:1-acyl-sn-glycerol-3-phosphate acyltransferase [Kordiimonas sp. SCSIO 12610]|uniref:lysophospholipid acyltransferase family protein n=1 Tax=Kordiimonas sp. SCSIO 12610 TaxID=2829597 RepID=UPI00210D1E30|nr:1-acyl-sn-glycerol-3-phosphate acyltransferase [Kordiimonas sp. SCSIO 12610]UTW55381.1 1-acyl-sn-glycerol-3-phosphate acyltransferase [Kordiimonas sp. SCSIO 12610]